MASETQGRQCNTLAQQCQSGRFCACEIRALCYPLPVIMNHSRRTPLRIVSLAPSATSILCAIGAKSLLVGVTKWCADIAPVGRLPKLGDCWHMKSVDDILRLKPTLVIGSVPYKQETVAKLLEQRLNFLAMNPRTLADIEADIRLLGGFTGRPAAAEMTVNKMRQSFSQIEKKAKQFKKRVRVYCEAWPNPRITSPPWVAELVKTCGGEFVVPAGEKISEAQVASAKPGLIVLAWAATGMKADPRQSYKVDAWKHVPAIRNRQVHVISDELLNTPGPPLVRGVRALYRLVHSVSETQEHA
jgi:iron complex transport system substrate-binding protein